MTYKLSPSILAADITCLGQEVKTAQSAGADYIHIDVMDGHFVPNITIGAPVVKAIKPHCNIPLDVHLMIENPQNYVEDFVKAGADIINDISALDWDKEMLNVIVNNKCPVILNHSSASPDIMQKNTDYTDVVDDIYNYLDEKIDRLTKAGISKNSIIIDPGIGFGKTTEQNFEILKRIQEFKTLGCAILIGHSRKNFIKETINTESKEKLDIATAIISEKLAANGVNILRVHNVVNHDVVKRINNLFI